MLIEKSELSKIKIIDKILENSDVDISKLEASLIIGTKSYLIVSSNKIRLQAEINIQEVKEDKSVVVAFVDVLDLCKVFTTKTNIEITIEKSKIIFSGLQGKETVIKEMVLLNSEASNKMRVNVSCVDTEEILVGATSLKKMIRTIPQLLSGNPYIELQEIHHKLCMYGYSDVELCSFEIITDNESRGNQLFLDDADMKILIEIIKQLKALEIGIGTSKNSIFISANGIDIIYNVKNKDSEISIISLIDNIKDNSNFIPYPFSGMDIDNSLQKNYVYINKIDGKFVLTNKEREGVICWPYRVNKLISSNLEINFLHHDKKNNILRIPINKSTNYYLMPKRDKEKEN